MTSTPHLSPDKNSTYQVVKNERSSVSMESVRNEWMDELHKMKKELRAEYNLQISKIKQELEKERKQSSESFDIEKESISASLKNEMLSILSQNNVNINNVTLDWEKVFSTLQKQIENHTKKIEEQEQSINKISQMAHSLERRCDFENVSSLKEYISDSLSKIHFDIKDLQGEMEKTKKSSQFSEKFERLNKLACQRMEQQDNILRNLNNDVRKLSTEFQSIQMDLEKKLSNSVSKLQEQNEKTMSNVKIVEKMSKEGVESVLKSTSDKLASLSNSIDQLNRKKSEIIASINQMKVKREYDEKLMKQEIDKVVENVSQKLTHFDLEMQTMISQNIQQFVSDTLETELSVMKEWVRNEVRESICMEESLEKIKTQLESSLKQMEKKIVKSGEESNIIMSEMRKCQSLEVEKLRISVSDDISEVKRKIESEFRVVSENQDGKLKIVGDSIHEKLKQLEERIDQDLEGCESKIEKFQKQILEQFNCESEKLASKIKLMKKEIAETIDSLSALQERFDSAINDVEKKGAETMNGHVENLHSQMNEKMNEVDLSVKTIEKNLTEEVRENIKDHELKFEKLRKEWKLREWKLNDIVEQLKQKDISEMNRKILEFEERNISYGQQIQMLLREFEEKEKAMTCKFNSYEVSTEEKRKDMESIRDVAQGLVDETQRTLEELRMESTRTGQRVKDLIGDLVLLKNEASQINIIRMKSEEQLSNIQKQLEKVRDDVEGLETKWKQRFVYSENDIHHLKQMCKSLEERLVTFSNSYRAMIHKINVKNQNSSDTPDRNQEERLDKSETFVPLKLVCTEKKLTTSIQNHKNMLEEESKKSKDECSISTPPNITPTKQSSFFGDGKTIRETPSSITFVSSPMLRSTSYSPFSSSSSPRTPHYPSSPFITPSSRKRL